MEHLTNITNIEILSRDGLDFVMFGGNRAFWPA